MRLLLTMVPLVVLAGSAVQARPLEPTKASQLVTLTTDVGESQEPCSGVERIVNQVRFPDGTVGTLVIPNKQVLVLQTGSWRTLGGVPVDQNYHLTLFVAGSSEKASIFSGSGERSDVIGEVSGSSTFHPGIVLRPGSTLCAVLESTPGVEDQIAFVHLQGFFAADK